MSEHENAIAEALERLNSKLDGALGGREGADDSGRSGRSSKRSRRRDEEDDDAPQSAASGSGRRHGRGGLEIQTVQFQVLVPVGRRGETMPGILTFPGVSDERELEDLAEEIYRAFKDVRVYQPKGQHDDDRSGNRGGYRNGNGYHRNGNDRGYGRNDYRDRNDRDRDDRDRR